MGTRCMTLIAVIAVGCSAGVTVGRAQTGAFPTYEAYVNYLGNFPSDKEADWTDDIQGIGHDEGHWYITQRRLLYRVPVGQSLNGNLKDKPNVQRRHLHDIPDLAALGYDHFGDISVYRGYVLAAVDQGNEDAVMAVFRADATLAYVGKGVFDGQGKQAGWVAVDGDGFVYSSSNHVTALRKYHVNWAQIESAVQLEFVQEIPLLDEAGVSLRLESMQGGDVSPSNRLIYLTNGTCANSLNAGVHVVDLHTGVRIARSCQGGENCLFRYQFDLCFPVSERSNHEPEGLTIWDLDGLVLDGQVADEIEGQLHILLLNNDIDQGNVWIKHYSGKVYVNDDGPQGNGRLKTPFNNLADALDFAWDGSTLVLESGTYPGSFRLDTHIRLETRIGVARIGSPPVCTLGHPCPPDDKCCEPGQPPGSGCCLRCVPDGAACE